jgi:hypothetical protein
MTFRLGMRSVIMRWSPVNEKRVTSGSGPSRAFW